MEQTRPPPLLLLQKQVRKQNIPAKEHRKTNAPAQLSFSSDQLFLKVNDYWDSDVFRISQQ